MQLQTFLFDDEDYKVYSQQGIYSTRKPETYQRDIAESLMYQCTICEHDGARGKPFPWNATWPLAMCQWPAPSTITTSKQSSKQQPSTPLSGSFVVAHNSNTNSNLGKYLDSKKIIKKTAKQVSSQGPLTVHFTNFGTLPPEMITWILSFLSYVDLNRMRFVNSTFSKASKSSYFNERMDTICFHSKVTFEEDVLGIGISLDFTRAGKLQTVESSLDILSYSAFQDGVRLSVWKHPFKYWIPLYICDTHAERAIPLFQKVIPEIYKGITVEGKSNNFVTLALDVLCKLMSSMIVQIMKGNMWASFKALEGYMWCHRWLIYFVQKYPALLTAINKRVKAVIENEGLRHKDALPNLGEFLPLLSVSDYKWSDVRKAIIEEVLDRNSLWIMLKNQQWRVFPFTAPVPQHDSILEKCFAATDVSVRLIMFHVYFIEAVALRSDNVSLSRLAHAYDRHYGRPSVFMQQQLQSTIFKIQKTTSLKQYFEYVGMGKLTSQQMFAVVCKAMNNAKARGYLARSKEQSYTPRHHGDGETATRGRGNFHRGGFTRGVPVPMRGGRGNFASRGAAFAQRGNFSATGGHVPNSTTTTTRVATPAPTNRFSLLDGLGDK